MIDWSLATQIFVSGICIVMLIMFSLQLTVNASSYVVRYFERRLEKANE